MDKLNLYDFIVICKIKLVKEILFSFLRAESQNYVVRSVHMSQDITFSGYSYKDINWEVINLKLKEMEFPAVICTLTFKNKPKDSSREVVFALIPKTR